MSFHKFKIQTHIGMSFRIIYLNACRRSELPNHVARVERTNKIWCG